MIYPRPVDTSVWANWFAWYPVKIAGYYIWLETVRCRKYGPAHWQYFSHRLSSMGVDH